MIITQISKKRGAFVLNHKKVLVFILLLAFVFSLNVLTKTAQALPKKYSLVSKHQETSIKDQGITGSCWAFGAVKSLESSCVKKGISDTAGLDLSESHLVWFATHACINPTSSTYGDGIFKYITKKDEASKLFMSSTTEDNAYQSSSGSSEAELTEGVKNNNDKFTIKSAPESNPETALAKICGNRSGLSLSREKGSKDIYFLRFMQKVYPGSNPLKEGETKIPTGPSANVTEEPNPTDDPSASPTETPTETPLETPGASPSSNPTASPTASPSPTPGINDSKYKFSNTYGCYNLGGNAYSSIACFAAGYGPANEVDYPFTANNRVELTTMSKAYATEGEINRTIREVNLKSAEFYDDLLKYQMKKAIMKKGALMAAMYYNSAYSRITSSYASYYQRKYKSYNAQAHANHAVAIVGWNDSFPRSRFEYRPKKNGAWLIANSYGKNHEHNGYFWLSYEEKSLSSVVSFEAAPIEKYDNIYQYDGFGPADTLSLYRRRKSMAVANVFTAGTSGREELKAVGFYTTIDGYRYKIAVYKHLTGDTPTSGERIHACDKSGVVRKNGYHVIDLPQSVTLDPGERFSVVVTYIRPSYAFLEIPFEGNNTEFSDIQYRFNSNKGESYFYYKNNWYDSHTEGFNSACIKALTSYTS